MVDKRSLLLGLGIGLIAGALLLQLMLAGKEQSERLADIDRLSGEDALYTQSELDALIAEAEDRVRREFELATAGSGEGAAEGRTEQAGAEPDGADRGGAVSAESGAPIGETGEAASGEGAEDGVINVRIRPGMTLTETARLLEAEGVIDDSEALMERMARMSTKIRAGYYTFTGNETLDEIRTILTSPPVE